MRVSASNVVMSVICEKKAKSGRVSQRLGRWKPSSAAQRTRKATFVESGDRAEHLFDTRTETANPPSDVRL